MTCVADSGMSLMSRTKKKDRELIAKFLPSIVREKGWEKQLDLHSIFPCWRELVSPDAGDHSFPLKIQKGVLWVEVENSAWLQQLQYEKIDMLERLNRFLSLGRLSDIKMVLPKKKDDNPFDEAEESRKGVEFSRPPQEDIAKFEQQAGCIEDKECREALVQFWYLANACRRKEE